jgi:hypothetical protein
MDLIERFHSVRDAFWRLPSPAKLVLGVALGSAALILLTVVLRLAIWWGSAGQATAKMEPRIAQMLGFLNARQEIARALESRTDVLTNLALADSGGSGRGGALLQQEIRKLAANNGLTIIGSEVQEPEILEDVDKLRVNVKATGLPENVARFFQSLNAYRPFLFISTFSINPRQRQLNTLRSPGVIYDNALSIQLDVYAYQLGDME